MPTRRRFAIRSTVFSASAATRAQIAPTVRHAMRINSLTAVRTESSETALDPALDDPGREALGRLRESPGHGRLAAHLGADLDAVTDARAVCQPAPEQRLALPAEAGRVFPERVAVGGVDPDASGVHEAVQELERPALVLNRAKNMAPRARFSLMSITVGGFGSAVRSNLVAVSQ